MNLSQLAQAADLAKQYETSEDRIQMLQSGLTQIPPVDIISQGAEGPVKTRIDGETVRGALISAEIINAENLKALLVGFGVTIAYDGVASAVEDHAPVQPA